MKRRVRRGSVATEANTTKSGDASMSAAHTTVAIRLTIVKWVSMMGIGFLAIVFMQTFRDEAARVTANIQSQFWQPEKGHYAAYVTAAGTVAKEPAFAWDVGVELSALAAAMRSNPAEYGPLFDQAQASLQTYGSDYRGVFGYGVLPKQSTPDRYYDDNEWIALAELDAYDASSSPKYLKLAKRTFDFVLSGSSEALGGGIFWREQEKNSKNTCSNAPAMLAAARLYLATHEPHYLTVAKELQIWLQKLKDPSDQLMFDAMGLNGHMDKTKWTYNSALMIRGDLALFKATDNKEYLEEAVAIGRSAITHWVDLSAGAIHDEGPFAHHLSEAFLALAAYDESRPWHEIADNASQFAFDHTQQVGLFGSRWDRLAASDGHFKLLYQASMARALWMAGSWGRG